MGGVVGAPKPLRWRHRLSSFPHRLELRQKSRNVDGDDRAREWVDLDSASPSRHRPALFCERARGAGALGAKGPVLGLLRRRADHLDAVPDREQAKEHDRIPTPPLAEETPGTPG
jgi:hypothetical protein